jgi:aarF domain-containing kinase
LIFICEELSPTLYFSSPIVLLLGVEEGRPQLGLIDYGQVKVLTNEERLLFCKIIIALADEDKEQVCSLMKEAGYVSKNMDPEIMYKYARVGYDEDNEELTEGKHIQLFMDYLHDLDPIKDVPQQYIMASRVSILLRGLGHAVHQSRSVAKSWKPIAVKVLKEEGQA